MIRGEPIRTDSKFVEFHLDPWVTRFYFNFFLSIVWDLQLCNKPERDGEKEKKGGERMEKKKMPTMPQNED